MDHFVHSSWLRRAAVLSAVLALVLTWFGAVPAQAAKSPVSVKAIAHQTVAAGAKATIVPRYAARKGVQVRGATVKVRQGSAWVARGVRSASLAPGTYQVTSAVTYRATGRSGRVRTASRTQTLRVVARPATPAQRAPQQQAAPVVPAPSTTPASARTPSLESTGAACDDETLSKPDGTPWLCSFADEFTGSALDPSRWVVQETATSGYAINGDCFVNEPENVSVGDGVLSLSVREQPEEFTCSSPLATGDYTSRHTSGMVSTWASFAQARGRFEIRAAFPATTVPGHHSALWLFPKSPTVTWPYSGEIDIAEMYSNWSDRVIPFIHHAYSWIDPSSTNNYCMVEDVSDFHTYTVEWTPSTISIAYDGRTCVVHEINAMAPAGTVSPFDDPFLIALTQGLGLGDNSPTDATPAVGTTKVDYVRVWK